MNPMAKTKFKCKCGKYHTRRPPKQVGEAIKAARMAAMRSQKALATCMGVSQTSLSFVENLLRNPTDAFVQKAADALGLAREELENYQLCG